MQCLEKYRSKLVSDTNRQLRTIAGSPEETAVHDFRVNIKRLRALYDFLGVIDENIPAKTLLKPYRRLFKNLGRIRDAQIAIYLVEDLEALTNREKKALIGKLRNGIDRDYRRYREIAGNERTPSIRLPTIRASSITPAAISKHRPVYLASLLSQALCRENRMTDDDWHRKRILLKRYRHILDAFSLCPGQVADQRLLKQISLLEQLLGDWHDRVVSVEILQALPGRVDYLAPLMRQMRTQERMLLGTARLYLQKFARQLQDIGPA